MEKSKISNKQNTIDLNTFPAEEEKTEIKKANAKTFSASDRAASCWSQFKLLKIELVMFLYMFSNMVRNVTTTSMFLDKVCLTHLRYPADLCRNLSMDIDVKTEVEQLANNYQLGYALISILPAAVLSCFIGPWSDKYGRRPPIIVAFVAIIIDGLGITLCANFMDSRVEYLYISVLFSAFSGGFIVALTVIYSYVTDISTASGRTLKYAFMEVAMGTAMPIGSLVGGYVFDYAGYVPVFLTATAGHVLGLTIVLFLLEETIGVGNTDSLRTKLRHLFSTEAFMDSFRVTMKKRPNKGRKQILLLLGAMSLTVLTAASAGGLMYMYVHHVYNWENKMYSTVSAVYSVFGMVAMLIAVPVLKRFRAGDPTLGIIGTVSMMLKTIGVGIATHPGLYYIANLTGLLAGVSSLAARSRISKVVSKNDLGKVFSFVTTAEMLGPILGSIAFSQIFNLTLKIYPGMAFLVCGGLLFFALAVFIWLAFLPSVNYEELQHDQDTVDESHETNQTKEQEKVENRIV